MKHPQNHVFDMTPADLEAWCGARSMKRFRARQILEWIYQHHEPDPSRWTNLAERDRRYVADELTIHSGRVVSHQLASDDTQKLLVQWNDSPAPGSLPILSHDDPSLQTECVMIPSLGHDTKRKTACISSQIGCPVGCRFCASGLAGLDGNLSTGRIVEQVWRLGRLEGVGRISHVVFMGMGEPLSNFSAVVGAIRRLAAPAPEGLGISARRITLSTVGLPKAIERLADELDLPITLALSLHAPTDEIRRELIPWAEYTTIDELLTACDRWFARTGREITLEYTLMGGLNDEPAHATKLAELAGTLRANVNLIRYNEVEGLPYRRPADRSVNRFQTILRDRGVNCHIRASRGRDIAAACGQLRHEHGNNPA
ncbi:MAG TPA: 23S rRNA (adenine(2503)-C(2))-methyltransferase RlmN [Phycisphaerales bacterium]|nr:23S rRNA (adenine(2503)-C(2))-methyltransferase RlmN [Phycisphaerales bacterium]